jgi:hypothetical protein
LDPLQAEGFQNLLTGLDDFFEVESTVSLDEDNRIEIFSSVSLESTDIIRTTSNFHGKPMFSNVTVSAPDNQGNELNWYGLVSISFILLIYTYSNAF